MSKLQDKLIAFANDLRGDGKQLDWEGLTAHERSVITSYQNDFLYPIDERKDELQRIASHFNQYGTKTAIPTRLLSRYIANRMEEL